MIKFNFFISIYKQCNVGPGNTVEIESGEKIVSKTGMRRVVCFFN